MVELLLRQRYGATDPEGASAAMQAVFGVGVATMDAGAALQYEQHSLVDDGVSATWISSAGSGVRMRASAAPDMVVILLRSGSMSMTQGVETVALQAGELGLIPLDRAAELRWEQVAFDAFSFPRASIGRLLGAESRQHGLHVARLKAASDTVITLWGRTANVLATEVLQNRELFESDIIREQAIDALLAVTIEAFGISNAQEDDGGSDDDVVQRASTYMRAHLDDPISIPDVARDIGISVRGLQLAFRGLGQGTPLMHFRALRMSAAREALTAPGAARTTTVGGVARGLGYTNLGRFSAHYREAFGETPIETLRPARAPSPAAGPTRG